jgi:hypothetical protein
MRLNCVGICTKWLIWYPGTPPRWLPRQRSAYAGSCRHLFLSPLRKLSEQNARTIATGVSAWDNSLIAVSID